jgi:hypothetical protein
MKSKILDAAQQTASGLRKSGAITEDTESFLTAVAGTLGDDFPNDITDEDLGAVRTPGAWSELTQAEEDWIAPISRLGRSRYAKSPASLVARC